VADLADLPTLAGRISRDLAGAGVPHAVSGAVAMAAHGYVRSTLDHDILVVAPALPLPAVFAIVRAHGFEGDDRALIQALRDRFVAALRRGPISVEIPVPVLPYHRRVLDRAIRRRVGEIDVPFVSVEDLVVRRMLWHRTKDLPDIQAPLATSATLDDSYIRSIRHDLLPDGDPRHAEIAEWIRRFVPERARG
jgi:hypothetical protein